VEFKTNLITEIVNESHQVLSSEGIWEK
jgi:hypothetical protein